MIGKEHHLMKHRKNRVIIAGLACFGVLALVGSAVAMPTVDTGGSASPTAVRPDDRAGVRGVVVQAQVSRAFEGSALRGEHSFGTNQPLQLQPISGGSDYNWGRTIAISAAGVALALSLVGLTLGAMRHRKPLHV
jgi:hypothetical protein